MLFCGCLVSRTFPLWFWLLVHCWTVFFLSCFNCFRFSAIFFVSWFVSVLPSCFPLFLRLSLRKWKIVSWLFCCSLFNNVLGLVVQCVLRFSSWKKKDSLSCCRLRGVVQFVTFRRRDCSGCLIFLGLLIFFVVAFTFFVKLKLVFNLLCLS